MDPWKYDPSKRLFLKKLGIVAAGLPFLGFGSKAYATVARRAMMAAAGVADGGNDSYTVLLAHMDGTDDAQVFTDSGAGPNCPHTMTAEGNVKTENTQKKFGTTSAYFDGTGDHIALAGSNDWAFGSEDFAIDCWIRLDSVAAEEWILNIGPSANDRLGIAIHDVLGAYVYFKIGGADVGNFTQGAVTGWAVNTWYHVALVRNGSSWVFYRHGTSIATNTNSTAVPDFGALYVGTHYATGASSFDGYIDELRISKGIARWTANFTPPNAAYYE